MGRRCGGARSRLDAEAARSSTLLRRATLNAMKVSDERRDAYLAAYEDWLDDVERELKPGPPRC